MTDPDLPGQVGGGEGGVHPGEVVIEQPTLKQEAPKHNSVGLEELAKTDRVLVQQVRVRKCSVVIIKKSLDKNTP